jgi:hypothetical protein
MNIIFYESAHPHSKSVTNFNTLYNVTEMEGAKNVMVLEITCWRPERHCMERIHSVH